MTKIFIGNDILSFCCIWQKLFLPGVTNYIWELYEETAEGILEVPSTFKRVMIHYFKDMKRQGIIESTDYEGMAVQFLAMNFGYVFLKASFGDKLINIEQEVYIKESVHRFVCGIQ